MELLVIFEFECMQGSNWCSAAFFRSSRVHGEGIRKSSERSLTSPAAWYISPPRITISPSSSSKVPRPKSPCS